VSHFEAVGFGSDSPEEMQQQIGNAIEQARPAAELGTAAKRHLWWCDPSGAALAAHLDKNGNVACITPFFAPPGGGVPWNVRTTEPHEDKECLHCSGADCDLLDAGGELVTRTAVQWLYFRPYQEWLPRKREYPLEVVGFASTLALCASAEELEQAQADHFGPPSTSEPDGARAPMRMADEALLPYGMFGNEGQVTQRARAVLTGTIQSATSRTNTLTGRRFIHARIRPLGGPIDVVAADAAVPPGVATAGLALADVWLVGRPKEPPPAPRPGSWFRKVFAGSLR
jgi:hypothetical protein